MRAKTEPQYVEKTPSGTRLLALAIGFLTLAVLPHINHLRFEVIAIFLALAIWRLVATRGNRLPRNRWIIYLFAIIGFSVSAWLYGAPIGRDPGVAFLLVLMGLKCVEISTLRDIRIVLLLGFFMIATHFLYVDGISWAAPLLGLVIALTWLMTQIEHADPGRYLFSDLKLVGKMLIQALPFVFILFYLFPRLSGSVFLFETEADTAVTGLSDTLNMGTISNLIQSREVAFTATFLGQQIPPPSERYWRGGVLWVTDGRQWTRGKFAPFLGVTPAVTDLQNQVYRYEIELEPTNQNWLYSLDYPISIPRDARLDADHHLYVSRPIERPFRYEIVSNGTSIKEPLSDIARLQSLNLGGTVFTPRLDGLVQEITRGTNSPSDIAQRMLEHFNQNDFSYTLQPPLLESDAPVDEFLFESRRGFCGHYASSFATIMRSAGIPARVVVGYLGGEHNPRSNQIVVRQSDAHAWTEIWDSEIGWTRVDPTASIAPERVEYPIDFDTSLNTDRVVLFSARDFQGLRRIGIELVWLKDAIKAKWNRWFVAFDGSRQRQLLRSMGLGQINAKLLSVGAFISALGLLSLFSFILFRRDQVHPDPVDRIYLNFCCKLKRRGLTRRHNEGPVDFAHRVSARLPGLQREVQLITQEYIALRYAIVDAPEKGALNRFRKLVRGFRASPGHKTAFKHIAVPASNKVEE
ncbi:MAG: DUF3488 and transglutaminase-like domain-containing protein [Arenicellales bacterium]